MDKMTAIDHLLGNAGSFGKGERLLILHDSTSVELAKMFLARGKLISGQCATYEIPVATTHGQALPDEVVQKMLDSDLIVSICEHSYAHSEARIAAASKGGRFLSMPQFTMEMLEEPAVMVDYRRQEAVVNNIANQFTVGSTVRVVSSLGTDISLSINGRSGNNCPGYVDSDHLLGSPPDIEANVSPIEDASDGRIVVDASITCKELGVLKSPVTLDVEHGRVVNIESTHSYYVDTLNRVLGPAGSKRRVVAECGVGLNPKAHINGSMLFDEGAFGCIHFGLGANSTVGGTNEVDFHLDFVLKSPDLYIDQKVVLSNGVLRDV